MASRVHKNVTFLVKNTKKTAKQKCPIFAMLDLVSKCPLCLSVCLFVCLFVRRSTLYYLFSMRFWCECWSIGSACVASYFETPKNYTSDFETPKNPTQKFINAIFDKKKKRRFEKNEDRKKMMIDDDR